MTQYQLRAHILIKWRTALCAFSLSNEAGSSILDLRVQRAHTHTHSPSKLVYPEKLFIIHILIRIKARTHAMFRRNATARVTWQFSTLSTHSFRCISFCALHSESHSLFFNLHYKYYIVFRSTVVVRGVEFPLLLLLRFHFWFSFLSTVCPSVCILIYNSTGTKKKRDRKNERHEKLGIKDKRRQNVD